MSAANNVTLIGNLVDDPELRFTASGVALANIRFAVNKSWKDQNGDWQEETSFFGGTVWRDQAEYAAESLQKGQRVIIVGKLQQRQWENDQGEKRSMIDVAIDEIGPSLRWATATVTKASKSDNYGSGYGNAAPAPKARDDYGPDEAPF